MSTDSANQSGAMSCSKKHLANWHLVDISTLGQNSGVNDTQHNDIAFMVSVTHKPFMLSVIMQNDVAP